MTVSNSRRRFVAVLFAGSLSMGLGACSSGATAAAKTSTTRTPVTQAATTSTAPTTTTTTTSTTTTTTTTTSTTTTTTAPPPPPTTQAAPTAVPVTGQVTAIGDSVMLDTAPALQQDIPGVDIQAFVSFFWDEGVALVQQLKAEGRLGSKVIIALGTNGGVTPYQFDAMMTALSGVQRVVFVTIHVDQPYQDQTNAVLAAGVAQHPGVTALADWASLADAHPQWLYPDQTHMPIGGPGAVALAALETQALAG